jgi:phosphatidylserine decarboxylase
METISGLLLTLIVSLVASTSLYSFLRRKTKIDTRYLFIDNPSVALLSALTVFFVFRPHHSGHWLLACLVLACMVVFLAFALTMIRFWRVPRRRVTEAPGRIVSPADGRVIYIRKLNGTGIPESVKGHRTSRLEELTKTSLLNEGGWHIGINMTPFDVHKNCAPISGEVIFNRHYNGKFLSLKDETSQGENERNTYVIKNDDLKVGVVQIASRLVRRIDSYVTEGQHVEKGEWIGMIRFGSQVDVIIPPDYTVAVGIGQQVYAVETIIAEKNEATD